VYLIVVRVPNADNLPVAYTKKMRKYAELSIEMKQQWQIAVVCTLPVIIPATGVIPHKLHDVFQQLDLPDFLHMTIQRSVILKTCNTV
jgi:hypothetical protein